MKRTVRFTLNSRKFGSQTTVEGVHVGDDNSCELIISVTDGNKILDLSSKTTIASMCATKPDGTVISRPCSIVDNNIVYTLEKQDTAVSGNVLYQITVVSDDGISQSIIATAKFTVAVMKNIYIPIYRVLESEPSDWSTNYTAYYRLIDNKYVAVSDSSCPEFSSDTFYYLVNPNYDSKDDYGAFQSALARVENLIGRASDIITILNSKINDVEAEHISNKVSAVDFQHLNATDYPNITALYNYHTNYVEPCYDEINNLEENKSDKSTTYTKTEVDEVISKYDYVSESVELVDGYYCNQSGQISAHSSFNYAVLYVIASEKYKISGRSAGNSALVVFFDKSDNMISAAGYDESGTTTTYTDFEVTVPNNAVKMILSTSKAVELTVKKYSIVSTVKDDIKSLQINKADNAETFYYDYQDITSALTKEIAYYKYTDGTKVSDTNSQSVYISTQSGERFKVSGKTAGNLALAVFFNCEKNYLSAVCYGSVTDYVDEIITVPPESCFVAFTSYKTDLIVKKYQPTTNKLNEIVYEMENNLNFLNSSITSLKGKSLYVDGDSIMYGYGSDGYSVGEFLRDKYGMTLTKGAVSGATLAVKADSDNSICTRLTALSDIYDYIIFDGGVNDVSQDITLGEITNHYKGGYDTTTTIGALEQICYTLVTNFLTVKKLFVFTHKIVKVSNPVMSDKMITCNNAIKSTLNKWGIPYVDLYNECNLCAINETINNTYFKLNSDGIGDRVHPTKDAYAKFYMHLIEAKIKNI